MLFPALMAAFGGGPGEIQTLLGAGAVSGDTAGLIFDRDGMYTRSVVIDVGGNPQTSQSEAPWVEPPQAISGVMWEIRLDHDSGQEPSGSPVGEWLSLSDQVAWTGTSASAFTISFRLAGSTTPLSTQPGLGFGFV